MSRLFKMYDPDCAGVLSLVDMRKMFSDMERMSEEEVDELMLQIDTEKTGFVTEEQFVRWWLHGAPGKSNRRKLAAWKLRKPSHMELGLVRPSVR
mmetsp:Transcript_27564/g.52116  ORF Transcript_27564/g.52116 Transcript_27564/m.52116 type:complete len:95 (+) Transcript_27564:216-500(+)